MSLAIEQRGGSSSFSACLPSHQVCLFLTLLSPSTLSLLAQLNISDKCPITTRLPLAAKLFPLPVQQVDSLKFTDSLSANHSSLHVPLDSSLGPQVLAAQDLASFQQKLSFFPSQKS